MGRKKWINHQVSPLITASRLRTRTLPTASRGITAPISQPREAVASSLPCKRRPKIKRRLYVTGKAKPKRIIIIEKKKVHTCQIVISRDDLINLVFRKSENYSALYIYFCFFFIFFHFEGEEEKEKDLSGGSGG